MKKVFLGVVAALMVLPAMSFAQPAASTEPAAAQAIVRPDQFAGQAEWSALMKKQAEARKALNEQLNAERDAFLKANPEVAARIEEQMKLAKERALAHKAAMQTPAQVK